MNTRIRTQIQTLATAMIPLALMLLAPTAHAQLTVQFKPIPTIHSGAQAQTISVFATLTNRYDAPLYLNSDFTALNLSPDPSLSLDDSPFQNTFVFPTDQLGDPLHQTPLGTHDSETVALFDILVPAEAVKGRYSGLFDFEGGRSTNDMTNLAAPTFSFNIQPAPVPEASTTISFGLLLAFGSAALIIRRKKAQTGV